MAKHNFAKFRNSREHMILYKRQETNVFIIIKRVVYSLHIRAKISQYGVSLVYHIPIYSFPSILTAKNSSLESIDICELILFSFQYNVSHHFNWILFYCHRNFDCWVSFNGIRFIGWCDSSHYFYEDMVYMNKVQLQ